MTSSYFFDLTRRTTFLYYLTMMKDEEYAELRQRLTSRLGSARRPLEMDDSAGPSSVTTLPTYHPINLLWRFTIIGGSLYSLHLLEVYQQVMFGKDIRHEWFKVGLGLSVAIAGVKGYVELYEGRVKKRVIDYETYKHSTHATILLTLGAAIAFHVALAPVYGWLLTMMIINGLVFFGVLLQFMLLVPSWIQNIVTFILMTLLFIKYQ